MSNLKFKNYGSSGHRQGDFREDAFGIRDFRGKGGTALPRTLQTMRENGTLAYTKISHKVYYRPEDVKAVFPVAEMKRCITAGKERICNVTSKQTSQPTNQPTNRYLTYE